MKTVNFKKLFSVILALVIIMGAVPFTAIPASAASTHSHPVCGSSCSCSDNHSSRTWTAWDGTTKMYNGNYYLTKDIELSSTMILDYSYSSSLCLNGYSITCEDRVFDIYSYRSLLISDCKGTGTIETTGYDCTIGNNRYLSVWGGTILNSSGYAIEAYPNTTTYVCGGKVESINSEAIYAYPGSYIEIIGGTLKGYWTAVTGHGQSGVTNGEIVVSGGIITSAQKFDALEVQSGNFTMTGGTADGNVYVFDENGTTTISGGTMGELTSYSDTVSITGGTMSAHLYGENVNISAGTFRETCMIMSDNCTISAGNFSDCDYLYLDMDGNTWIYGGYYGEVRVYSPLYLSGVPEIGTLKVMKPGMVSAQNPDASGSYGGDAIDVVLDNALTSWKDGDVIIKNVRSDSAAEKFNYVGDDSRWVSFERSGSNLVLDVIPHGSCGNNAYWAVEDNTLYIYGAGAVTYNDSGSKYPWWPYVDEIENIIVEEGITKIPAYTFEYCESAKTITLPETLTELHISAFNDCKSLNNLLLPSSLTKISYYNCYINRCDALTDLYYLGTAEELRTLLNGSTLSNWGGVPVLNVHCLELYEGSATCTEGGTSSYYQFDDTSVYSSMYDMDKNPITSLDTVPALGHDEIHHEAKAPTCTESGWNEYVTCSRCDYTSYAELAPLGHEYADGVCIRCGDVSVYIPEGLVYWRFDGKVTITGYTGSAAELVIPETIEGCPVTEIDYEVFKDCESLTSITLPEGVTSIATRAFSGCNNLTSINIPERVTYIGIGAFRGCGSLTSITIPEGVTSIGNHTFGGCSSLTNVTIPDAVTNIGTGVFENCSSFTSITIPDGVTSIGHYAFRNCTSLVSITIPDSLTTINAMAFAACENLTTVYYMGTVAQWNSIAIGSKNESFTDAEIIFLGEPEAPAVPEGLVYKIVDGQVTITGYTGSATELVIPETIEGYPVTVIGDYAFHECSSLARITLPASVTSIGDYAFNSCKGLTSIILSEGIISIGDYVFNGSINLKSLTIPASVTSFGVGNVARCNSLISLNVAEGNSTYYSEGNCIIKAADGVLVAGCNNSVIPAGVSCIGTQAFSNCISIESIIIPDGVTSIEDYAFTICTNLTSIDIPDSVITIGMHAFSLCESLTSIILPENLTTIGQSAFYNCTRLESITISENVTHIEKSAFYNCSSLSTVYYGGTEEEWNVISIGSDNENLANAEIIFLGEAEEPAYIIGDIDGNGTVNGKDSYYLACVLAGKYAIEEGTAQYLAADVDGDGIINAKDAFSLKCIVAGILAT